MGVCTSRLHRGGLDVGVEVARGVESYLQRLAAEGVEVTLSDAVESSGTIWLPNDGHQ